MGGAKYMVGWPAGRPDSSKKRAAGGSAHGIRAALFFEKPGRPAGQPTMYLDPPIHFGGILLVLVYYLMYFPYYGGHFPIFLPDKAAGQPTMYLERPIHFGGIILY